MSQRHRPSFKIKFTLPTQNDIKAKGQGLNKIKFLLNFVDITFNDVMQGTNFIDSTEAEMFYTNN